MRARALTAADAVTCAGWMLGCGSLWETSGAKIIDSWGEFATGPKSSVAAETGAAEKGTSPAPGRAGAKVAEEKAKPKGKAAAAESGSTSNRNVKQVM